MKKNSETVKYKKVGNMEYWEFPKSKTHFAKAWLEEKRKEGLNVEELKENETKDNP